MRTIQDHLPRFSIDQCSLDPLTCIISREKSHKLTYGLIIYKHFILIESASSQNDPGFSKVERNLTNSEVYLNLHRQRLEGWKVLCWNVYLSICICLWTVYLPTYLPTYLLSIIYVIWLPSLLFLSKENFHSILFLIHNKIHLSMCYGGSLYQKEVIMQCASLSLH